MTEQPALGFAPLPDGGRLSYTLSGPTAAPTLLLNRPLGGSMALWGAFAEELSRSLRVISFDPRGAGRSSDVPWGFTTRDMARDAVALLDHLGIERTHVFGLSLGGMVASWIAADFAQRTDALVLASTISHAASVGLGALRRVLPVLRSLLHPGAEAEVRLVWTILSPEFRSRHPDRVTAIARKVRGAPSTRRNLLILAIAATRHETSSALARSEVKTLLLFGDWDRIASRQTETALLRELKGATLEHIPEAGHDITLEQPTLTAARVARFVRP